MASRTWLAVGLACLVWFAYMKWFVPPMPQPGQVVQQGTEQATPAASRPAINKVDILTFRSSPGEITELKSEGLLLRVNAVGGKVWEVRDFDYRETLQPSSPPIGVLDPARSSSALSSVFTDEWLAGFSGLPFEVTQKDERSVTLKATNQKGATLTKSYELQGEHFVSAQYSLSFPEGTDRKQWGDLIVPVGGQGYEYDYSDPLKAWEVVSYQDGSVTRKTLDDLKDLEGKKEVSKGKTGWLSFGNRYFTSVVVPQSSINPDVVFLGNEEFQGAYLRFPVVLKADQKSLDFGFRYYFGPKDVDMLRPVPGLTELIDYGMFAFLAHPLLWLLRFFYGLVHNYGVAIILLTVLVRLLFYPLSVKSYRSMKEMQKIQPQLKALREKYKDDMQKFNQEQIALFKTHKVNPMGGCLPMLVQLPVFFALYTVLSNSIELFHAPFVWWIQDLSAKDPYYIVPVLMGLSMVVQQKMTPTAGMDPTQAKIMMLMPVVFTFVMLSLPSGLTVYIFLSTLLGIIQQWSINRDPSPKVAVAEAGK